MTADAVKRPRERLDVEMVKRGLAPSLDKARALIMAGQVRVGGQMVDKPDHRLSAASPVEVAKPFPFVSRGALKIERAIRLFGIDPRGLRVLDVGISTGGFSDYLLQQGAASVTGVDVTISQVAPRLRSDPRVRLLQKNARYLQPGDVVPPPGLIVVDLSFISVRKVLPALSVFPDADLLVLLKPQFEAERNRVGKGGVVRQPERRCQILLKTIRGLEELGYAVRDAAAAGVTGRKGNQEYFLRLRFHGSPSLSQEEILLRTECADAECNPGDDVVR